MPFNGPVDPIEAVLRKLGIDPRERLSEFDQDPEYTACMATEVPAYFDLYQRETVTRSERAVLCCFILEGLNEYCAAGSPHSLQTQIFDSLFAAGDEHEAEIAYWMNTSDLAPDNWWPITSHLITHRNERRSRGSGH